MKPLGESRDALNALTGAAALFFPQLPPDPLVFDRSPETARSLLSFAAVDDLLTSQTLHVPFVEMARADSLVPRERYTLAAHPGAPSATRHIVDTTLVRNELEKGATLVLNLLHLLPGATSDFARRLERELGMPVRANAFLTPPRSQGFAHHYDTDSSFIVQLEGEKVWQLVRPHYPWPLESQKYRQIVPAVVRDEIAKGEPDREVTLRPGSVLWIPRGWIHNVFTLQRPSLHLALGIAEVSGFKVIEAVLDELRNSEDLRLQLPTGYADDFDSAARTVEKIVNILAEGLTRLDHEAVARRVLEARRTQQAIAMNWVRPVELAFGEQVSPRALRLRLGAILMVERVDGALLLHLDDVTLRFVGEGIEIVDALLVAGDDPVRVGASDRWTRRASEDVARTLIAHGAAVRVDDISASPLDASRSS